MSRRYEEDGDERQQQKWAQTTIGTSFFLSSCFLTWILIIYVIFRLYLRFEGTRRMGKSDDDKNGPK
jgi:hypothetical protein